MNRTTGTGFIAFGLVLVVVGAVLRFAMTASTDGFDTEAVGMIAIIAGVVAALIGLLLFFMGSKHTSTMRENVVQTPGGSERIQERDDFNV
jgi:uncharacterized membrane protein YidH (DUF202 family)